MLLMIGNIRWIWNSYFSDRPTTDTQAFLGRKPTLKPKSTKSNRTPSVIFSSATSTAALIFHFHVSRLGLKALEPKNEPRSSQ